MRLSFFTFIFTFFSSIAFAQSGNLDNNFGTNATTIIDFAQDADFAFDGLVQNDGKILILGHAADANSNNQALVRLNSNGSLDNTFNGTGAAILNIADNNNGGNGLAIQNDGKIVVVGELEENGQTLGIISRFLPNGNLDSNFGADGFLVIDFDDQGDDFFNTVAIQNDGKILVAGIIPGADGEDLIVIRLNADGALDNTFANAGAFLGSLGGEDVITKLAFQQDGKIIAVGHTGDGTEELGFVFRLNTGGALDASFGVDGFTTIAFNGVTEQRVEDVNIQNDGKIIIGGQFLTADEDNNFFAIRLESNGSIITNDVATIDFQGDDDQLRSVDIQNDGKILLTGYVRAGGLELGMSRLNADFTLDQTFGLGGVVNHNLSPFDGNTFIASAGIQPNGRIIAIGDTETEQGFFDFVAAGILNELNVGTIDFSSEKIMPSVYPNPIEEQATLEFTLENEEILSIEVYDIIGNLVQTVFSNKSYTPGPHAEALPLGELKKGIYVLQLRNTSTGKALSVKIFKK